MSKRRAPSQRQLRVGEELRHALARILARDELRDPALVGAQVTVTEVRVGPDLRNATAYVTPLGGGDAGPLVAALRHAAPYLRGRIAEEVRLRFVPTIEFAADASFDRVGRIERLLRDPVVARDLAGAAAGSEDDDDGA